MSCSEQSAFHGQASDRAWFFSELLFQSVAALPPKKGNNISGHFRQTDSHFFGKIRHFSILFLEFAQISMKCYRNFANSFEHEDFLIFFNFLTKIAEF